MIFIFEHKVDRDLKVGIKQTQEKYLPRYSTDNNISEIHLVSINFNSDTSNIESAVVVECTKSLSSTNGISESTLKEIFKWEAPKPQ